MTIDTSRAVHPRTAPSGGGIGLAIALVVVDALLTVVFSAIDLLNSMSVAGCGPETQCNIDAAQAAFLAMPIAGGAATVVGAAAAIVTGFFSSRVWLPPLIATGVIIVTFIAATIVLNVSL